MKSISTETQSKSTFSSLFKNGTFTTKTSLKIFKHYKLKPSFPIIKDNKTKDRAGVGDKPPPTSYARSINPNFIQKLIRTATEMV